MYHDPKHAIIHWQEAYLQLKDLFAKDLQSNGEYLNSMKETFFSVISPNEMHGDNIKSFINIIEKNDQYYSNNK